MNSIGYPNNRVAQGIPRQQEDNADVATQIILAKSFLDSIEASLIGIPENQAPDKASF